VITITGIRDHHRLEHLITIPGMRRLPSWLSAEASGTLQKGAHDPLKSPLTML
jgi:hypothetical protein